MSDEILKNKFSIFSRIANIWKKETGRKIATFEELPEEIKQDIKTQRADQRAGEGIPHPSDEKEYDEYVKQQLIRVLYNKYYDYMSEPYERTRVLDEYDLMCEDAEIASALDIYADESCVDDEHGNCLQIYSDSRKIKDTLEELFYDRLNVNMDAWYWIRNACKYGDNFLFLEVSKNRGLMNIEQLPVREVVREEGFDPQNTQAIRYVWTPIGSDLNNQWNVMNRKSSARRDGNRLYFDDWQIAHMRLLTDEQWLPYGTSILEPIRKTWKQLQIMEDAMIIYRITRAPERRAFFIDVGNIDPKDVDAYMQQVKSDLKKTPLVDKNTGQKNLRYNPLSPEEDFFVPVRGDKGSRIESLPGACIDLNTKIPLLDGRVLSLNDIIFEFNKGNKLWVYSCDNKTGEIVPGEIGWAGVTRKNTDVFEVTLDNNKKIICTPDHKFITWNGKIEAQNLLIGESIIPFIRNEQEIYKDSYYEHIYDHKYLKYRPTHRIVAEYFKNIEKENIFEYKQKYNNLNKNVVHHIDCNKNNNTPENLCWMDFNDHWMYHCEKLSYLGGEATKNKWKNDKEFANKMKVNQSKISKARHADMSIEKKHEIYLKVSNSLKKYIKNINENNKELWQNRLNNCSKGGKIGIKLFNDKMSNDNNFYNDIIIKRSKSLKKIKNTKEYKIKSSKNSKILWKNQDYVDKVMKNQRIKFSNKLIKMFINEYCTSGKYHLYKTVDNLKNSIKFNSEFKNLNNKCTAKCFNVNNGFTYNHAYKLICNELNFCNVTNFRRIMIEKHNHKIVSIKKLDYKIDTGTITVNNKFHNFAIDQGIFIANSNLDEIADIEYIQRKIFAGLKIPKAFLTFEEELSNKSALSNEDVRFARTINRVQQVPIEAFYKMAMVHLIALGYEEDIDNFSLSMTNPSTQSEQQKLELMSTRADTADRLWKAGGELSLMSFVDVQREIFGKTDSEIKTNITRQWKESNYSKQIEDAGTSDAETMAAQTNPQFFDSMQKSDDDTANEKTVKVPKEIPEPHPNSKPRFKPRSKTSNEFIEDLFADETINENIEESENEDEIFKKSELIEQKTSKLLTDIDTLLKS